MKRRSLLFSVPTLAALKAPGQTAAPATAAPSGTLAASAPALFCPTASSITVTWAVNQLGLGTVTIGEVLADGTDGPAIPAANLSQAPGFHAHGETVIHATIPGLTAGKRYWYEVATTALEGTTKDTVEKSARFHFRLPSADQSETTFAVWNDTHDAKPTLAKLHEMTRAAKPDFLLWNGDISNNVDRVAQLTPLYLAPGGGLPFAAETPCFHSRGNHDVRGLRAALLGDYIDFPNGKPYYSFRFGPLAGIVLDTGEDKPDNHRFFKGMAAFQALREEQAAWLKEEISKPHLKNAPYRVVFCHIPLRYTDETIVAEAGPNSYDYVSIRSRNLWHDSLVAWGTQLIISGHTHEWGYLEPAPKFPYAQLIGGGPKAAEGILIHGKASKENLAITLTNLQDKVVKEIGFKPVG